MLNRIFEQQKSNFAKISTISNERPNTIDESRANYARVNEADRSMIPSGLEKGGTGVSDRDQLGRKSAIKVPSPPTSVFSGRCSAVDSPRGTIKRLARIVSVISE